jgi:hypothetical protein
MMIQNFFMSCHDASIHAAAAFALDQRSHPKAPTPFVRCGVAVGGGGEGGALELDDELMVAVGGGKEINRGFRSFFKMR